MSKNASEIQNVFTDNLKRISKKRGYATKKALFDAIYNIFGNETDMVSESAVHSWWSYVSIPDIKNILRLCKVLDCEMNYFFTDKDFTQNIYEEIYEKTGLIEESIRTLKNAPTENVGVLFSTQVKPLASVINNLLSLESGVNVLLTISDYISLMTSRTSKKTRMEVIISENGNETHQTAVDIGGELLLKKLEMNLILLCAELKKK